MARRMARIQYHAPHLAKGEWLGLQLLLIGEDASSCDWLAGRLSESGFVPSAALSADQALRSGLAERASALIVNVATSGQAEHRFVRPLRAAGILQPLLVLSSQCDWRERVDCLDAGADDYLTKPVRAEEVAARLRAIIRRSLGQTGDSIVCGDIELNIKARTASLNGEFLDLTRNEFRLLRLLLLHRDRALTHAELRNRLYSEPSQGSINAVEANIARLRRKIGKHSIRTIRGVGYRFIAGSLEGEGELAQHGANDRAHARPPAPPITDLAGML